MIRQCYTHAHTHTHTLTHMHTHHAHAVICRGCLENQANKPGPRCADPFDSRQRVRSQESAQERQHYCVAFKSKPLRTAVLISPARDEELDLKLWSRQLKLHYCEAEVITFNNAFVNYCFSEFKTTLTSSRFTVPETISLFLTGVPFASCQLHDTSSREAVICLFFFVIKHFCKKSKLLLD